MTGALHLPRIGLLVAVAALGLLGGGCGGSGGQPSAEGSPTSGLTSADLEGGRFTSTSVAGHDLAEGSRVALSFQNGTMAVTAGCNTQTAAYQVHGDTLRWAGAPASTLKACSPALEEQDRWLADLFSGGVAARLDGSMLTLTRGDVAITLAR